MSNATTKTLTAEQQANVDRWIAQGVDRETAIRVATVPVRKAREVKGTLTSQQGFSLLK